MPDNTTVAWSAYAAATATRCPLNRTPDAQEVSIEMLHRGSGRARTLCIADSSNTLRKMSRSLGVALVGTELELALWDLDLLLEAELLPLLFFAISSMMRRVVL